MENKLNTCHEYWATHFYVPTNHIASLSQESQLLHVFSVMVTLQAGTDLGRGPRGLGATWFHFFFLQIIFINFVVAPVPKH